MGICESVFLCLSLAGATPPESSNPVGILSRSAFLRTSRPAALPGAATGFFFDSTAAVADDASKVVFSIYGGKLYFRNLNVFNPQWEGCCYSYYIDLTSDEGKAMYAYFMMQYANRGRIVLWRESVAPGPIQQVGNWG